MSHDGRAVANFVLDVCEQAGREVTNLSLQKIVFFCHAWSLAVRKEPLVKHEFEAWQFGPVLQYLYREFKVAEREPIRERASRLNPSNGLREVVSYSFDSETVEFLTKVVRFYSRLSAGTLVELSHVEGGPWHGAWNYEGGINPGMRIADQAIAGYYSAARPPF